MTRFTMGRGKRNSGAQVQMTPLFLHRLFHVSHQVNQVQAQKAVSCELHPNAVHPAETNIVLLFTTADLISRQQCLRLQEEAFAAAPARQARCYTLYANVNRVFANRLTQLSEKLWMPSRKKTTTR